jgi:hypothetical protein
MFLAFKSFTYLLTRVSRFSLDSCPFATLNDANKKKRNIKRGGVIKITANSKIDAYFYFVKKHLNLIPNKLKNKTGIDA